MAAPLDLSSISDVRLPPKGGRKAAVTSCPGYNSLGQSGDKARSTPLEVQSARGGGWTCKHGLMAGSLGKPRVHDKRGVQGVSLAKEMMEVWTHQEPSPCLVLSIDLVHFRFLLLSFRVYKRSIYR